MKSFFESTELSKLYTLNSKDIVKGIIVAMLGGMIDILLEQLISGSIDVNKVVIASISAGLAYIKVRFFSDEKGDLV